MNVAQQMLQAQIVLSGRLDGSFGKMVTSIDSLGNKMLALASGINQISQPLINAGKQITTLYAGFDDSMKYIKAIGNLTEEELAKVENAARQAGATTRYTATQAAEALAFGAEAGLEFNDNISLLPTTLNMAAAGNMELETAMDQLLTMLYSTGTPLNEASTLVDQLAAAASSSKTNIQSMGEAVERMGGITRYAKGGTEELFTMLGMLAQRGTEGAEAGTYLRNVILSLVAPTKKAGEVLAELGATDEELADLEDLDLGQAAKAMENIGLKTYDAEGNLRPFMDVLNDLNDLTKDMTEQERNDIMSKLFPKRTLSAATNLLGELGTSMERISDAIEEADGTAKKMAETRESGIGGAIRMLKSASEELQLSFGEVLTDKLMSVVGIVKDALLTLASLPENVKGTLVDIAAVIAGMGPAAMLAGFGLKAIASLLGFIGSPVGMVMTGVLALGVLALHVAQLAEANRYNAIKRHFGELEINADTLAQRVSNLDGGLGTALDNLDKYGTATETAGEKYNALAQTLSGNIMDSVIFGRELTEEEQAALFTIGDQMASAVQNGIKSKQMEITGFVDLLFKDDPTQGATLTTTLNSYFGGMYLELENIGEEFRSKLTEAMRDGTLDENEWEAIKQTINRFNEMSAKIQDIQNAAEVEKVLQKGMRLGPEAFQSTLTALDQQKRDVETRTTDMLDETIAYFVAASREEGKLSEEDIQAEANTMRDRATDLISKNNENTMAAIVRMINVTMQDAFPEMEQLGTGMMNGILQELANNPDLDVQQYALDYLKKNAGALGITGDDLRVFLDKMIDPYQSAMDETTIAAYEKYYADQNMDSPEWLKQARTWNNIFGVIESTQKNSMWEQLASGGWVRPYDYFSGYTDFKEPLDENVLSSLMTQYGIMGGASYQNGVAQQFGAQVDKDLIQKSGFAGLVSQMGALGAEAGKAFNSSMQSQIQPPSIVGTGADGDPEVSYIPEFAEGGRATTDSIFGENGPEWAIPEGHTERTAELLNLARSASGFTWPELIAMAGGLTGNPGTGTYNVKIVYAPVIHAADAAGVEEKLKEDKQRFRDQMDDYLWENSRREM